MHKKVVLFLAIHGLLILIWIAHLAAIQIFDVYNFENQNVVVNRYKPKKRIIQSIRGNIYDSHDNLLVSTSKYYRLEIKRNVIQSYFDNESDLQDFYEKIGDCFQKNTYLSKKTIINKLNYTGKANSIFIAKNLTIDEIEKVKRFFEQYKMNCLYYTMSFMNRKYLHDNLADRLLGFVKSQADSTKLIHNQIYKLKGLTGIEKSFDEILNGKYGWEEGHTDANGHFYRTVGMQKKEPIHGNSIKLTIDAQIQEIAERNLNIGMKKYEAKHGVVVIIEPATGKILAMASSGEDDHEKRTSAVRLASNLGVSMEFEPGSTFKTFPVLLSLEDKIFAWDETINCRTYHTDYDDRVITDHKEFGDMTLKGLLTHSSNPGVSRVAEKIGEKKYWSFLRSLGFGRTSGLSLKGETRGTLNHYTGWSDYSLHSLSFGQEITVNAVQLAKVYAAIANDGKMMRPYILEQIISPNGKVEKEINPDVIRQIASRTAIDTLKMYLQNVVDEGTATYTKFKNITCAGKTGTAEKTYSDDDKKVKYYTSFAGFLPVESPKYAAVVVFDEPKDPYDYASSSAVPVFKHIFDEIIQLDYCPIIPESRINKSDKFVRMPMLIGLPISEATNILRKNKINWEIIGNDAVVTNQIPATNAILLANQKVIISTKEKENNINKIDKNKMPNFVGLSIKEAYDLATECFVGLVAEGNGIIKKQKPKAGEKIEYGDKCVVVAD